MVKLLNRNLRLISYLDTSPQACGKYSFVKTMLEMLLNDEEQRKYSRPKTKIGLFFIGLCMNSVKIYESVYKR